MTTTIIVPHGYKLNVQTDGSTYGTFTPTQNYGGIRAPVVAFTANSNFDIQPTYTDVTYVFTLTAGSGLTLTPKLIFTDAEDSRVNFTDNIYGNVSSLTHGYAPKNPNDATKYLDGTGTYSTPNLSASGQALTRTNDANVTLTLGGSAATALVNPSSITVGWTGQLSVSRGGTGNGSSTAYALIAGGTTSTSAFQALSTGLAGQILQSGGAGALPSYSTPTYPSASATSGKRIKSDGTNWVATITTLPDSGTSRKVLIGDGTNYVESTETWATPSTSGNLLTSDGANWVSSAPATLSQAQVLARISVGV